MSSEFYEKCEETEERPRSPRRIGRRERERRRRMRRRKVLFARAFAMLVLALFVTGMAFAVRQLRRRAARKPVEKPEITEDFLTVNPYSRPGEKLGKVKNIFVHYTANPNTSAANNRSYFENLKDTHETSASTHFVIGIEGEIIQCIPLREFAYTSNYRNIDTISIECCHPDESGEFTQATYDSLVKLTAWLCDELKISRKHVIRHYDVTGKSCPKYFVDNEDAWTAFKEDVEAFGRKREKEQ